MMPEFWSLQKTLNCKYSYDGNVTLISIWFYIAPETDWLINCRLFLNQSGVKTIETRCHMFSRAFASRDWLHVLNGSLAGFPVFLIGLYNNLGFKRARVTGFPLDQSLTPVFSAVRKMKQVRTIQAKALVFPNTFQHHFDCRIVCVTVRLCDTVSLPSHHAFGTHSLILLTNHFVSLFVLVTASVRCCTRERGSSPRFCLVTLEILLGR